MSLFFDFSSTINNIRMIENYENPLSSSSSSLSSTSPSQHSTQSHQAHNMLNNSQLHHNQFDCLVSDVDNVNVDAIANDSKPDEDLLNAPSTNRFSNSSTLLMSSQSQHHPSSDSHINLSSYMSNIGSNRPISSSSSQLLNMPPSQTQQIQYTSLSTVSAYNNNNASQAYLNVNTTSTATSKKISRNNSTTSTTSSLISTTNNNNNNNNNHYLYDKQSQQHLKQASNSSSSNNDYTNNNFATLASKSKFQYVLMAPTSPAVKINEDTLTYLNQGQSYELRLSKSDLSPPFGNNHATQTQLTSDFIHSMQTANTSGTTNNQYHATSYQNQSYFTDLEDIKPVLINGKICNRSSSFSDSMIDNSNDFNHVESKETNEQHINLHSSSSSSSQSSSSTSSTSSSASSSSTSSNINNGSSQAPTSTTTSAINMSQTYLSIIRLCFWDRKFQEIEQDEIKEWEKEYPNTRMLEIDSSSSYGIVEIRLSDFYTNVVEVMWNGKTGANIFFRCNCTSTAFAPHKHGGEKGIHLRFQIDTYEYSNVNAANSTANNAGSSMTTNSLILKHDLESMSTAKSTTGSSNSISTPIDRSYLNWKHASSSYCRIQLFRLKGAQRKLKTDRNKIERLNPIDLRKRYQQSNKLTLLCNCVFDPLYSLSPLNTRSGAYHRLNTNSNFSSSNSNLNMMNGYHNSNHIAQYSNLLNNEPSANSAGVGACVIDSNCMDSYLTNSSLGPSGVFSYVSTAAYSPMMTPPQAPLSNDYMPQSTHTVASNYHLDASLPSEHQFYLDQSYSTLDIQQQSKNDSVQLNHELAANEHHLGPHAIQNSQVNYSDTEPLYQRLKRKASMSSLNGLNQTSTTSNYYIGNQANNGNIQSGGILQQNTYHSNAFRNKIQRTSNYQYNSPTVLGYASCPSSSSSSISTSSSSAPSSPSSPNFSSSLKQSFPITSSQSQQIHQELKTENILVDALQSNQETIQANTPLPHDSNNKVVQEWLLANRFGHLLQLFTNYTSNDLLRLSKEDLINLCGAPDGIRCFNIAHNIRIRPKLTIFIRFLNQSYYSAIFLADWQSKFLIDKIFSLYSAYINSTSSISTNCSMKINCKQSDHENSKLENCVASNSNNLTECEPNGPTNSGIRINNNTYNEQESSIGQANSKQTTVDSVSFDHLSLFEHLKSSSYDYELFLKIKGILVKTTDEVLNNLQDQSKFLVEFELPSSSKLSSTSAKTSVTSSQNTEQTETKPTESFNHDGSSTSSSSFQSKNNDALQSPSLVKLIMIPLD